MSSLRQSGDDLVQHRLQLLIGRLAHLDEDRRTVSAWPVHAVQHQAVQMDVQVGRRPKALDQRDRAAVGLGCGVQSRAILLRPDSHSYPERSAEDVRGECRKRLS